MKIIKAGTRIHITCDTGTVGTESRENYTLTRNYTEKELDDVCFQLAVNNAEMYGIYQMPFDFELSEDDDEDEYSDDICGYWELYNHEEHEGYFEGGEL